MGMDYRYSGSASYPRFADEINMIDELVSSDDVIFVSWIANPYTDLSAEDTKHIYNIIEDYAKHHPAVELPVQPVAELEYCVAYNTGWCVYQ